MEQLPSIYPPERYGTRSSRNNELLIDENMIYFIAVNRDIQAVKSIASTGKSGRFALLKVLVGAFKLNEDTFFLFVEELVKSGVSVLNMAISIAIANKHVRILNTLLSTYDIGPNVLNKLDRRLIRMLRMSYQQRLLDQATLDTAQYLIDVMLMNGVQTKKQLIRMLDNTTHHGSHDWAVHGTELDVV